MSVQTTLTRTETATYLGVTERKLGEMVRAGMLAEHPGAIGRAGFFLLSELDALCARDATVRERRDAAARERDKVTP